MTTTNVDAKIEAAFKKLAREQETLQRKIAVVTEVAADHARRIRRLERADKSGGGK